MERAIYILVVDDDPDTLFVTKRLLQRSGYLVDTAHNIATALSAASSRKYNCVISDLVLPDGSGYELMGKLATMGLNKGIAISGLSDDVTIDNCRKAGFTKYLAKPFHLPKLLEALKENCS